MGFPGGAVDEKPTSQCRRQKRCGFDPWGFPVVGNGNPLQCSYQKDWTESLAATVHGVAELDTTEHTHAGEFVVFFYETLITKSSVLNCF